ncbi:hypothetical protein Tco_0110392 [Tanacetum coccineum]
MKHSRFLKFLQIFNFLPNISMNCRGKRCEKNYSSVRRYVADPVNAYPKQSTTKLILKGAVIFDVVSYQFRCALNYSKLAMPGRQKSGKCCVKNYSSMRRYIADPDNAYPKRSITKLILKGAVIFDVVSYKFRCALNYSKIREADSLLIWGKDFKAFNQEYAARIRGKLIQKLLLNQKFMGYLVHAYYSISPTRYYKDDSCWSVDLKSNTTEDVISIRSFMEVLVLNHYVPVRKIL